MRYIPIVHWKRVLIVLKQLERLSKAQSCIEARYLAAEAHYFVVRLNHRELDEAYKRLQDGVAKPPLAILVRCNIDYRYSSNYQPPKNAQKCGICHICQTS